MFYHFSHSRDCIIASRFKSARISVIKVGRSYEFPVDKMKLLEVVVLCASLATNIVGAPGPQKSFGFGYPANDLSISQLLSLGNPSGSIQQLYPNLQPSSYLDYLYNSYYPSYNQYTSYFPYSPLTSYSPFSAAAASDWSTAKPVPYAKSNAASNLDEQYLPSKYSATTKGPTSDGPLDFRSLETDAQAAAAPAEAETSAEAAASSSASKK